MESRGEVVRSDEFIRGVALIVEQLFASSPRPMWLAPRDLDWGAWISADGGERVATFEEYASAFEHLGDAGLIRAARKLAGANTRYHAVLTDHALARLDQRDRGSGTSPSLIQRLSEALRERSVGSLHVLVGALLRADGRDGRDL